MKIKPVLGYTAAGLTLVAAALIPFVLIGLFTEGVAATGVRVAPAYSGGEPAYTIDRGAYRIIVNHPVRKTAPLQRIPTFVQLEWTPESALPARITDNVDIDSDGTPDASVSFDVPRDRTTPLRAEVSALTPKVTPPPVITRQGFSCAIARVDDGIVVRLPLAE